MSTWLELGWWAVLAVGLLGTAMYSGLETGLYFLSRVKLEVRAAHGPHRRAARLLRRELEQPERLLATNLIGTIFFSDMAATGASALLSWWGYSDVTIVAVNVALLTPLLFVFCETVPKELFRLEADRLMYVMARPLAATRWVLTMIGALPLVRWVAARASGLVGGEGEAGLAQSARERIATMLKDSAGTGVLTESQAGLVDRALAFQRMTVGEVMTPWVQVRTVPADWSREQLVRLLSRERIDVLAVVERGGESKGVAGVLRFEDAFVRTGSGAANLLRRPARLPARMGLPDAAAELREAEVEVGIVEQDGKPVGLVLLADVLEPLVG